MKAQYSRKTILGVIGLLVATGGYGGYTVVKGYQKYGGDFETRRHIVARVIDGDTVELEDKVTVRLLGVNAPERGECYFDASKGVLEALAEGQSVLIEKDITGKDRYGRLLRYLKIPSDDPKENDVLVNNELVRRGAVFALSTAPDTKYRDLFATSQRKAKEAGTGLWGACNYETEHADLREEDRKDFYFYVDEFQNFATDTFAEILSEARKYRLCLTIAHQYIGQLDEVVRKTVFWNVGSMVSFRVGAEDAVVLAEEYTPIFNVRDIINLGVREFYLKMSIDGELSEAFSGKTLDVNYPETDHSRAIIEASRQAYCAPREEVEDMLLKWDEGGVDAPLSAKAKNNMVIQETEAFEAPLL